MAVDIPFPLSTAPGTHFQEASGRIINGYAEPLGETAPTKVVYRRAPGLTNFGTTTKTGFRGALEVSGTLYCAFSGSLVKYTSSGGAATVVGTLNGTRKGFFARNNKSPTPDQMFVDPDGNVATFTSSAVTNSNPAPAAINSICTIDGFFVATAGSAVFYASNLNSTTFNALSFGTAESKPDTLLRGVPYGEQLFLFGGFTTEVWSNVGTTPFPFQRATVIPRGLAGPYCVAGHEDNFGRALVWIGDDNCVYKLNGYNPDKISPPDLDGLIEAVSDKATLEVSVYMSRGHAFVLVSSPTWSWVLDLNTQKWAERISYNLTRSRITGGIGVFGKWLCGDTLSGNVQQITSSSFTEPPRSQLITGAVSGTGGQIRLTVGAVNRVGNNVVVAGVLGTTEANGGWPTSVINATQIELVGSTFANAYVSGGVITDMSTQPFRMRLESGPVEKFPTGARVGRADFNFVTGVGASTASRSTAVTGAVAGTGNRIRLSVASTLDMTSNDAVTVAGVLGTTEANGTWQALVLSPTTIELLGSTFAHAWVSGGTVTDLNPLTSQTDPSVEISWSDDGGQDYSSPLVRKLGRQSSTRGLVSLVASTGRSGWNGRRWRMDISDPVYVGFMGATQSESPTVNDQ